MGKKLFAIQIPAGGVKKTILSGNGKLLRWTMWENSRCQENLIMKGDEVFLFVQKEVASNDYFFIGFCKNNPKRKWTTLCFISLINLC